MNFSEQCTISKHSNFDRILRLTQYLTCNYSDIPRKKSTENVFLNCIVSKNFRTLIDLLIYIGSMT
jgi:hypothetical protein